MENEREKLTVDEAVTWWSKNKKWVWPTIVGAIALLGGNADRIDDFLPESPQNKELVVKVDKLVTVVEGLVKVVQNHEEKLNGTPVTTEQPAFRE
jgi:hypothetical protein